MADRTLTASEERRQRALRRLVPWLDRDQLVASLNALPLTVEDVPPVATRAAQLGLAERFADAVLDAVVSATESDPWAQALNGLSLETRRSMFSSLASEVAGRLHSPTELVELDGTVTEVGPNTATIQAPDGNELEVSAAGLHAQLQLNSEVRVIASSSDGIDWSARSVTDRSTGISVTAEGAQPVVTPGYSQESLALLSAVAVNLKPALRSLKALLSDENLQQDQALATLALAAEASPASSARDIDPILDNPALIASATLASSACDGIDNAGIPSDVNPRSLARWMVAVAQLIDIPLTLRDRLNESSISSQEYVDAAIAELEEADGDEVIRVAHQVVAPVDPSRAAELIVEATLEATKAPVTDPDDPGAIALAGFGALSQLAENNVAEVRAAYPEAMHYSKDRPAAAAANLALRAQLGLLSPTLRLEFLTVAARFDAQGALAALGWLEANSPVAAQALIEVLIAAAYGLGPDFASHERRLEAVVAANRGVPKTEQFAALAGGYYQRSKEVPPRFMTSGDPLTKVLSLAKRSVHDVPVLTRRLTIAESWAVGNAETRRVVERGFVAVLEAVGNGEELRAVLQSLERFFPTAQAVPHIGALRKAGLAAAKRVAGTIDSDTAEVLERVISTLRWNISKTADAVRSLRAAIGV